MTRAQETLVTLLNAWRRCRCGNDRFRRVERKGTWRCHGESIVSWRCTTCWRLVWLRERDEPGSVAGPPTNARVARSRLSALHGNAWGRT